MDVSSDGATLLYEVAGGVNARLWGLPLKGDGKPFQIFPNGTDAQRGGRFSPDGKWIAYESGPPNGVNVYVQPFPATGDREQISTTTGYRPRWTADGRQIVFVTLDGTFMTVDVTTNGKLHVGRPKELFRQAGLTVRQYDMDAKGERFLLLVEPSGTETPTVDQPLTVLVNMLGTLKKNK
jgi:hypothetical protein